MRLLRWADVVVQNLRPGVADRLSVGFEGARLQNPRVVYATIGAYGSVGPLREEPGYDPLMQAAAGIMSVTGEPARSPVRAGVSLVDLGTGVWAALAVVAALHRRDQTGDAQFVETSLLETALNWMPYQIVGYLATGIVPGPEGSGLGIIAPYQAFVARDGWIMIAAGNNALFAALCDVIGLPELAVDPRFTSNPQRVLHRDELAAIIQRVVESSTTAEWLERLRSKGVPASVIQDVAEVVEDPQTEALGILQTLPHSALGDVTVVAPPISVNHSRVSMLTAPPMLGADGRQILAEIGFAADTIDKWFRSGTIT